MVNRFYKTMPFLILAVICACISSFFEGLITVRMMGLLDYAIVNDTQTIKDRVPMLLAMAALLVPMQIFVSYTASIYRKKAAVEIKNYYINGVFKKNIAEFQKENTAKYISALTNDCEVYQLNLIDSVYNVLYNLSIVMSGIWVLSTVNPGMILFAIAVTAVNTFVVRITSAPLKKAYEERSQMFESYTSHVKEILSAFHIIKNSNLTEKITEDYYKKSEDVQNKSYYIDKKYTYINSFQTLINSVSFFGFLCVVGYMAVIGKISIGGFVIVGQGISKMTWPLFQITETLPKITSVKALITKMENSLLNRDNYEETIELQSFEGAIEFKDVAFKYEDGEENILNNINLRFNKNGKYLIIGPSGGGKSTLLKLLRKYYSPTQGNIYIDGHNLKDVKKESYFKILGNVEQQVFVFEDTVLNNITLYKNYSQEEIDDAIDKAGLRGFVDGLAEGLNTVLYDNGKNISGGERSRLVIARALLQKSQILFMDEAFASLDMERAAEIEKTILDLKDITVINVSHVLFKDTKDRYDKIIRVKGGIL